MEHFGDLSEVGECSFLGAHSNNLWWSHDKLLLLTGHHLWVFVPHDTKHSLKQFLVRVVAVRVDPRVVIFFIFFLSPKDSRSRSSSMLTSSFSLLSSGKA